MEVPDAGDEIEIPPEMEQSAATFESEDVNWADETMQKYINEIWQEQGKPASDDHWAYIEVDGEERYLVALVPIYGLPGDYVDIYVTNNGVETVYPCIIGDSKDIWVDAGFTWNDGKVYGHDSAGKCNIVEIMSELSNDSSNWSIMAETGILDKLKGVTKIVNGGNIEENPDGPGISSRKSRDSESETLVGSIGSAFRSGWVAICTFFENLYQGRDDATVLYSFKDLEGSGNRVGAGSGDIVAACEAVTEMLMERQCYYSLNVGSELISGDIDRQLYEGKYFCCATYVAAVLYYAGVLTEDQINAYNYHWTGDGGIPTMLEAAGWKQVSIEEVQPGDVINDKTVHVMIYAGNGEIWDQTSAVYSSTGTPPTGTTYGRDISGCEIWRAP